jgi:dCTP deaminase
VLLSDRDIRSELSSGRVGLDPLDLGMVQPSSVDVRLDRFFRLFDNHKYQHIDPSLDQPDLTRLVEVDATESFVLHPGEFVLGATYEVITRVHWVDSAFSPTPLQASSTPVFQVTSP